MRKLLHSLQYSASIAYCQASILVSYTLRILTHLKRAVPRFILTQPF